MIRINLLPIKELKAEVVRRRELTIGGVSLALTGVLILGVYLYQWRHASVLENELVELRKELQVLNVKAKDVAEFQKRNKEFEGKNSVIENINKKKSGPVRIMETLSLVTPSALWITEFKEAGGNATITGVAADNQTIAAFLRALGSNAYFSNTELVEATQTEQKGMPPGKFSIKSRLTYQPAVASPVPEQPATAPAAAKGNSK
jgi:type IV pilus assembly protein PilN